MSERAGQRNGSAVEGQKNGKMNLCTLVLYYRQSDIAYENLRQRSSAAIAVKSTSARSLGFFPLYLEMESKGVFGVLSNKQANKQTNKHTNKQTYKQTNTKTNNIHTNKQINKQTNKKT